jgi:hypothetical protein
MALQWQAAVPSTIWLDTLTGISVTRAWTAAGLPDLILRADDDASFAPDVDVRWSHRIEPAYPAPEVAPGGGFLTVLPLAATLRSAHLTDDLGGDLLRHVADALLDRLPEAVVTFVTHRPQDTESIAHCLLRLWLASGLRDEPEQLLLAYERAANAVAERAWGPHLMVRPVVAQANALVLRTLAGDVDRLAPADVLRLVKRLTHTPYFDPGRALPDAERCLRAVPPSTAGWLPIDVALADHQVNLPG